MSTTLDRAAESGTHLREIAQDSRAWPFEEARKLLARLEKTKKTEPVIFETGYGPSGLPHIGTFGEVARTTMVRHAFEVLTGGEIKSRLICFSDDMDGMRKVPENVPNRDLLARHIGKPLTRVPDPFETHESFGHHNNAMLRSFLDAFGFDYEFASATDYYAEGRFDEMLLKMLARYDDVMDIMLPTLREERQKTYSPFLPLHPETGVVMQVPVEDRNVEAGTIVWTDPDTGRRFETPVTGGRAKAQWKPDWALRWAALGIDYEMSGKDHIDNVKTSSKICRVLGGLPPDGFNYELFLDENGEKISKSRGNGLTIEEWLRYASQESLALFMYQRPREAKKLHWDVIPRHVDEYFQLLSGYARQDDKQRLSNPVWHIHSGNPPEIDMPVSFALLLNLVSASNAHTRDVLWGFIGRYAPGVTPETHPHLDAEVGYALRYYEDHVRPTKVYRAPDEVEREALQNLDAALADLPEGSDAAHIQNVLLDVARPIERYQDHKKTGPQGGPGVSVAFFNTLYEVLLGQSRGPRFGSFVALYGIANTRELIGKALSGGFVAQS